MSGGDVIQLGTDRAVSIGELFEAACRAIGAHASVVVDKARVRPAKSEVMVLLSDPTRAAELLGWEAAVDLEENLRRTASWLDGRDGLFDPDRYHV